MAYRSRLNALSDEDLNNLESAPPSLYSQETVRKDRWVDGMWREYCTRRSVDAYPIVEEKAMGFLRLLSQEMGYARSSLSQCVLPGLFRLHAGNFGEDLDSGSKKRISRILKNLPKGRRIDRDPFLYCDAHRVIGIHLSQLRSRSARHFSMLLVAMQTGARVGSIADVHVSDILNVTRTPAGLAVSLRFRNMKTGGTHEVTIEGSPSVETTTDSVFWLREYLQQRFGLELADLNFYRDRRLLPDVSLWGWRSASLAQEFKGMMVRVGYDPNLFSFHSLRRGCLANHIILSRSYDEAILSSAITANWVPNGQVQQRYANPIVLRTRICTRFNQAVEPALTTPNAIHRTSFRDSWANQPMIPRSTPTSSELERTILDLLNTV
jgi:hypothetical protein